MDNKTLLEMHQAGTSIKELAHLCGVHRSTVSRRISRIKKGLNPITKDRSSDLITSGFEIDEDGHISSTPTLERWDKAPTEKDSRLSGLIYNEEEDLESIDELILKRKDVFNRLSAKKHRDETKKIRVTMRGPIAITHFGDPHVDDDGCHWPELIKTVKVVSKTPGMFGGNIGDTTNNWVGRLQRLYAEQSTTLDDSVRLAHWLLSNVPWMYVVLGNHDKWNQGSHLIRALTRDASIACLVDNTARLELSFPEGDPIRILARHDFTGRSIWNRAHGALRESKMNPWADIYVAGHRHIWVSHHEEGMDSKPRWALLVRGFKYFDEYADEKGFHEHQNGESCTTILDPTCSSPMERIRVVWDIEEAADMLTYLRNKRLT